MPRRKRKAIVQDGVILNGAMSTEVVTSSSCAGRSASKTRVNALMTRASIFFARKFLRRRMDCRVKPGNDGADGYVRLVHVPRLSSCCAPSERNPQVRESGAGAISLFPVVINNDFCNSSVSAPPRPKCVAPNVTPHMSPTMWHHPSSSQSFVIPCVTIRRR